MMAEDDEQRREFERRRRGRNIAIALVLAGLVVLFYLISIARLSGN